MLGRKHTKRASGKIIISFQMTESAYQNFYHILTTILLGAHLMEYPREMINPKFGDHVDFEVVKLETKSTRY